VNFIIVKKSYSFQVKFLTTVVFYFGVPKFPLFFGTKKIHKRQPLSPNMDSWPTKKQLTFSLWFFWRASLATFYVKNQIMLTWTSLPPKKVMINWATKPKLKRRLLRYKAKLNWNYLVIHWQCHILLFLLILIFSFPNPHLTKNCSLTLGDKIPGYLKYLLSL
jgi:hypothetical protein